MADVKVDFSNLDYRIKRFKRLGQTALANQIYADTNRYVPKKDGDLRNFSHITLDEKHIVYNSKYSAYQYHIRHSNYTTPGTGPNWDEVAKRRHMWEWENVVKKAWERS